MVKSHYWLVDYIEPMFICLAIGGEVVSDLMYTVPIVFCDIGGHAIKQYVPCQIIKNLQYDKILGMDWIKSTNPVIIWVFFSLHLTVGAQLHTVLSLPVNSVANLALSILK